MKKLIIRFFIFLFLLLSSTMANAEVLNITPQDTFIDQASPTQNYSTAPVASLGGWEQDDSYLLLPTYPAELKASEIIQARLQIPIINAGGTQKISLRRINKPWIPTEATWLNAKNGTPWSSPGANADYIQEGELKLDGLNGGLMDFDITSMVKAQIESGQNYGFIFTGACKEAICIPDEGHAYINPNTAEGPEGSRPVIIIETGKPGIRKEVYIRSDGGTVGLNKQCTGTSDKPYPGSGINQPCAAKDMDQAAIIIKGGDRVTITVPGKYSSNSVRLQPGTPGLKTVIEVKKSCNWDKCVNPLQYELYGEGGAWGNILTIGHDTVINDISMTDHSSCTNKPWAKCDGQSWVGNGLVIEDGEGVELNNFISYGLSRGVQINNLGNMKFNNFQTIGNAFSNVEITGVHDGWPTIEVDNFLMGWPACGMKYPVPHPDDLLNPDNFHHCCSQDQGCYGDNFAVNHGSAFKLIMNNGRIVRVISDAVDTIYAGQTNTWIHNLVFEHIIGASVKVNGVMDLDNDTFVGVCQVDWVGKPYVTTAEEAGGNVFNSCRGNSVLAVNNINGSRIVHNTFATNRDILFDANTCDGTANIDFDSNVVMGGNEPDSTEVSDVLFSYTPENQLCYQYFKSKNNAYCETKDGAADAQGPGDKYFAKCEDMKFKVKPRVTYPNYYTEDTPINLELASDSPILGRGANQTNTTPVPTPTPDPTPCPICSTCPPPTTCPPQTTCPPPVVCQICPTCPNPPVCTIPTSKRITPTQFKAAKGFKDCTARAQMNDPCEVFDAATKEIFVYKKLVE